MLHTGPMDELKGPKIVSISAVIRDNLRGLREEKKWSQERLARELDVSVKTVWRWENEGCFPNRHKMHALSSLIAGDVKPVIES